MPGGWGILGSGGLRQRVTSTRLQGIEDYVHKLANQSLQMDSSGNVTIAGTLTIGAGGAISFASGAASIDDSGMTLTDTLTISQTATLTDAVNVGAVDIDVTVNPASASSTGFRGVQAIVHSAVACSQNLTTIIGLMASGRHYGSGTLSTLTGATVTAWQYGGDVTDLIGFLSEGVLNTGTSAINYYGLWSRLLNSGSVTTGYGLFLSALGGTVTNKYGIWQDGTADSNILKGGVNLGSATEATTGTMRYSGDLEAYRNLTYYTGYIFVPLMTPLTSTSWDGDSYSTTAKTLIDLSTVFSAPAGIKAILCYVGIRDSASAANDTYMVLSPNNTAGSGLYIDCHGQGDDTWERECLVVPCDANGDVYYQIAASGASTLEVYIQIFGYWI